MRILHTSDWHLGASLGGASREREHARFLDWLVATMRDEQVDVLVVAGDIFDHAQPSSEAQSLYYRFLATLGAGVLPNGAKWPRHVVVVGGNHDSASRLDAPREVLGALSVSVVGGYDREREDDLLIPIRGEGGAIIGVVAAVPYVNEYRLGVTVRDADPAAAAKAAFSGLYTRVVERAVSQFPGVPLVATGHLTCSHHAAVGAEPAKATSADADESIITEGDFPQPIHSVGTLGALPPSIFDLRWDYVALGHIHRAFPPEAPRVWYSGTPIPVGFTETAPRRVLLVDLEGPGAPARVRQLVVPLTRELVRIAGDEAAAMVQLRACRGVLPLPPLVDVAIDVPIYDATLPQRVRDCVAAAFPVATDAPIVARLRQLAPEVARVAGDEAVDRARRSMSPWEIFGLAWTAKYKAPPDETVRRSFERLWHPESESESGVNGAEETKA